MNIWENRLFPLILKMLEDNGTSYIVPVATLNKLVEVFSETGQYAIDGDDFLCWAWFSPSQENDYLSGNLRAYDDIIYSDEKRPWIICASMRGKILKYLRREYPSYGHKKAYCLWYKNGVPAIRTVNLTDS